VTTYTTYDHIPQSIELHIDHPYYWRKPDTHLHYILKDAAEAAENANGMGDHRAEAKYLDQINDAVTVLAWRRREGVRVVY